MRFGFPERHTPDTLRPTAPDTAWLERLGGDGPLSFTLYEDDGLTRDYAAGAQNRVELRWDGQAGTVHRDGGCRGPDRYRVVEWIGWRTS
jgi:hypothetical protein